MSAIKCALSRSEAGSVTRRAGAQRRTAEPLTRPAISLGLTAARRWSPSRHARRAHSASSTTGRPN